MRVGRYGAIGFVAISLGACGGSTSGTTAAAACRDLATKDCARAQACAPGVLPFFGYLTAADCVSAQADLCERSLAQPHTGYTPARARACGDALGAMTCQAFLSQTTSPACFPKGGTIPVGGSCSDGWQCASGRCYAPDLTRCGTCLAQVPLGQACTTGAECADNLVCSASAAGSGDRVCMPPVAIGGACNDGAVCPTNALCDQTRHTCTRLPALGDACDPSVVFFCDLTVAAATCDAATSRCVELLVVQPGAACSASLTVCLGGFCSSDADGGAQTCVGNVPNGGSCAPTDQCEFFSGCVGGVCQPFVCDGVLANGAAAVFPAGTTAQGKPGSAAPTVRSGGRPNLPIPALGRGVDPE